MPKLSKKEARRLVSSGIITKSEFDRMVSLGYYTFHKTNRHVGFMKNKKGGDVSPQLTFIGNWGGYMNYTMEMFELIAEVKKVIEKYVE